MYGKPGWKPSMWTRKSRAGEQLDRLLPGVSAPTPRSQRLQVGRELLVEAHRRGASGSRAKTSAGARRWQAST